MCQEEGENMYSEIKPKCGEIWMCHLVNKDGSVQAGYRPVFILSNDINNAHSPTLNIIPLTTKMNKRHLPVHVEIWNYEEYGLKAPSTLMIEQTTTIPIQYLEMRIGYIDNRQILMGIWKAITIQFPIMQMVNPRAC